MRSPEHLSARVVPTAQDDGPTTSEPRASRPRKLPHLYAPSSEARRRGSEFGRRGSEFGRRGSEFGRRGSELGEAVVKQIGQFRSGAFGFRNKIGLIEDRAPYTIHPRSPFMLAWNMVNATFISACAFFLPFQVCFGYTYSIDGKPIDVFWAVMWPIIDSFFFIDLFLNFRISYYDDGELEQDAQRIAAHYLRNWFSIDFVSCAASLIDMLAEGWGLIRNMRVLKLLKLLRLARVARMTKILQQLGELAHDLKLFMRLLKLFMAVTSFAHVIACCWWAVGSYNTSSSEYDLLYDEEPGNDGDIRLTWFRKYYGVEESRPCTEYNYEPPCMSTTDQYWGSIYWAFITITTVGFGDIVPTNNHEMAFAMLTTCIGTGLFAFITGEVTAMATSRQASSSALAEKLNEVHEFMRYHRLPRVLRHAVREYYETSFR